MARRRPRDRKAQITLAARRLFDEFGYHNVGVDAVAAEVGIGGSALYRHYPGKQDLLFGVIVTGLEKIESVVAEITAKPSVSITEALAALASVAIEQRGVPALWQREARYLRPLHQEEVHSRISQLEHDLAAVLKRTRGDAGVDTSGIRATAILSTLWSVSYHNASLPRPEFEALLVTIAQSLYHVGLRAREPIRDALNRTSEPPPPLRRGARREMLLASASRLFGEKGFSAVSMDEVAAELGLSGPSVYRHFRTKSDLLLAALIRGAEALHLSLSEALAKAGNPSEGIDAIVASYVDVMLRHNALTQLLITEVTHLRKADQATIRATQRAYVADWVHLLQKLRPELTAEAARVIVHAALTVVNDLLRSNVKEDDDLRDDATTLARTVLVGA